MSIATLPPIKHKWKEDCLKCKLLKKVRKNIILYKKYDIFTKDYIYTISSCIFEYSNFEDALYEYHKLIKDRLKRHHKLEKKYKYYHK